MQSTPAKFLRFLLLEYPDLTLGFLATLGKLYPLAYLFFLTSFVFVLTTAVNCLSPQTLVKFLLPLLNGLKVAPAYSFIHT